MLNIATPETSKKLLGMHLQSGKSFHLVSLRTLVHLHDPQTPNQRDIRERLTVDVVQRGRVEGPVLGFTPCGIGYRAEVNPRSGVKGEWMAQGIIASGECDRIVANFGSQGGSNCEERRVVGNLILGDDGREVEGSVHELSGSCN